MKAAILTATVLTMLACSSTPVNVVEVMHHTQCRNLPTGASTIEFDQLAKIRGGRLLSRQNNTPSTTTTTTSSNASPQGSGPMYVIYNGPQPTAGYRLTLQQVAQEGRTVNIHVQTQPPPAGALVNQVITHPCLVIQLQGLPEGYNTQFFLDDTSEPMPLVDR